MSAATKGPIRGTQTFVGLMSVVWKRPLLTLTEIGWRWLVGAPLLFLAVHQIMLALAAHHIDLGVEYLSLSTLSVFRPVEALSRFHGILVELWPVFVPVLEWYIPVFAIMWPLLGAMGRTLWLRRYEPQLTVSVPALFLLMLLRMSKLVAVVALWIGGAAWALRVAVLGPVAHQQDANLVLFAAMVIGTTLLLFMLWSVTNWPIQLAPLVAMSKHVGLSKAIADAIRVPKATRSRLMEINLVMGVVKIGLLVLTLVFTACPLPFSSVETTEFLVVWDTAGILLWLCMSDYFHVVRTIAYLRFFEIGNPPAGPEDAS